MARASSLTRRSAAAFAVDGRAFAHHFGDRCIGDDFEQARPLRFVQRAGGMQDAIDVQMAVIVHLRLLLGGEFTQSQPLRSAYMRKVIEVQAPRPDMMKSKGAGPASAPPMSTGSSARY